jgi:hypothetical protein
LNNPLMNLAGAIPIVNIFVGNGLPGTAAHPDGFNGGILVGNGGAGWNSTTPGVAGGNGGPAGGPGASGGTGGAGGTATGGVTNTQGANGTHG